MMAKDFTKITTSLLLTAKDLAEWGIAEGHTTPEKLRLTVAAREAEARRLVDSGMSQRKAAKLLGVSEKQIRRDVRPKAAKSADKGRTPKRNGAPPDTHSQVNTMTKRLGDFTQDYATDFQSWLAENPSFSPDAKDALIGMLLACAQQFRDLAQATEEMK